MDFNASEKETICDSYPCCNSLYTDTVYKRVVWLRCITEGTIEGGELVRLESNLHAVV